MIFKQEGFRVGFSAYGAGESPHTYKKTKHVHVALDNAHTQGATDGASTKTV